MSLTHKILRLQNEFWNFKSDGLPSGKAYFNALVKIDPRLADRLRNTTADPFDHDDRIRIFLSYVYSEWSLRP